MSKSKSVDLLALVKRFVRLLEVTQNQGRTIANVRDLLNTTPSIPDKCGCHVEVFDGIPTYPTMWRFQIVADDFTNTAEVKRIVVQIYLPKSAYKAV